MRKGLLLTMAAAAGMLAALPARAGPPRDFGYWDHPMMGFGWMFGFVFMLLMIVLIVAAVIFVLRWLGVGAGGGSLLGSAGPSRPDPLDILKERLARGEISVAEYEERKRALSS
jgi:putative membrane protein